MKTPLTRLVAFTWLAALSASADVLINEININPPGGNDAAWQYVEILTIDDAGQPESQTLGNLSVLFVDTNGNKVGTVEEALDLEGQTTGTNGLLLIGINFDQEVPWAPAAETAVADFDDLKGVGGTGEIGPKGGLSVLLVENFTGKPTDDLDGADRGTIGRDDLIGRIVDSVGYGDDIAYRTKLSVDFSPDNLSRIAGENQPNRQTPWIGGEFQDTDKGPLEVNFADTFGDFTGTATPGQPNPPRPSLNPIRINEVLANPPGEDANVEFIELISTTGGITTTNNLWLLVVDSDRDDNVGGEVLEAWNLDGQSTGSNGLLVLGHNYRGAAGPWKDIIEKDTSLFDPDSNAGGSSMGPGDIGSNASISILLVRNFTGRVSSNTTTGSDLDTDDDGIIDQRPWDTSEGNEGILDSVGFDHINDTTGETWWETYAIADVTQDSLALAQPDSLVRHPGNLEPNQAAAWMGGDIGGESTTGIAYRPAESFGDFVTQVSPGQPNHDATPEQALILINEVHLNPPGDDGNREYIEFLSPSRTFTAFQDLTLLIVDVSGDNKGEIKNVIALNGLATGGNGLLLMGDSYNDTDVFPNIPQAVHRADPAGLNAGEIGPNSGVALLLVKGFTGQQTDDLDTDDDGLFETVFWESVMDSVSFGADLQEQDNLANFNFVGESPHSFCRIPGDFRQNDTNAWYGGLLDGASPTSVLYADGFGHFIGEATPGRFNLAGPRDSSTLLLNEVHINPPGNDDNYEFIELISPTGSRQSTNNLSLVLLENAGNDVGDILEVWPLDGMSTGSNGLLLLGHQYPPLVHDAAFREGYWDSTLFPDLLPDTPFDDALVDQKLTAVADPLDLGNDNIGPNTSFTLILVRDFNGEVGDDVDGDNDGFLDTGDLPWDTSTTADGVLDGVAFLSFDDNAIPPAFDGKAMVAADLSATYEALRMLQPDNLSRRVGNFEPNSAAAWYGGEVAGNEPGGLAFRTTEIFGDHPVNSAITPGLPNVETATEPGVDSDNDGVSDLDEQLAGTDPNNPRDYFRVTAAARNATSVTLSWSSVAGKTYELQYSPTLEGDSWIAVTSISADSALTTFTDDDPGRQGPSVGFYRVQVSGNAD